MKRNKLKKKKHTKSTLARTQERLTNFQTKYPYKFRQVFENYNLGQRQLSGGRIEEAQGSFEKALAIYNEYIPAQNHLAVIYGMLHNYKEALLTVKKVLKLDDKNVFAFIQGAMFLYRLDREKEAISYAESALKAFQEREGHDPYNDYDMLQKLVEMLSVLRQDAIVSQLYKVRTTQLAPMSLYRSSLALSNEGFYEEAYQALDTISGSNELQQKASSLKDGMQMFLKHFLPLPMFYAEEHQGFEQLMVVSALLKGEEQHEQAAIDYFKNNYNDWSLQVMKALLTSQELSDWVKKGLLAILADWGEAKQPLTIMLDGIKQQVTLQPVELTLNGELEKAYNEGKVLLTEKKFKDAINKLEVIREGAPTYVPVYLQLAEVYTIESDFPKAKELLEEAVNIAPLAPVYLGFSKYYLAINEPEKASQYLDRFDIRELENADDVYEAISLKVKTLLQTAGHDQAMASLQKEKEKFGALNGWNRFEENLLELLDDAPKQTSADAKKGQSGISTSMDLSQLLERYTKDKLIGLCKSYNIRGYSKLNKKVLIELIITEVYNNHRWKQSLSADEELLFEKLSKFGNHVYEAQLLPNFKDELEELLIELENRTAFETMNSHLGKLLAKGVIFVGVSDNNEWMISLPK